MTPAKRTAMRLNMSRAQGHGDPFQRAIRKYAYTQSRLAEVLGISASLLSMYRKGVRPIPRERAERVKALTGWAATAKGWPGGILEA